VNAESVFGATYADCYDLFYRTKDYAAECDFLEMIFKRYVAASIHSIVDLGCGTGGHSLRLAERGYAVTGVDRSEEMLRQARSKVVPGSTSPVFYQGDIRTLALGRTFDAAIMLFAVMSYLTANADLAAALTAIRRHLTLGGLFVADFWYGPAVLAQRPTDRVGEWSQNGAQVLRMAHSRLDLDRQTVEVNYRLLRLRGAYVEAEAKETHVMRFLFPQELAYFASQAGFELVRLLPFAMLDGHPSEQTWDVGVILRAIGS
jgi:SAM-dependent methyltransferase